MRELSDSVVDKNQTIKELSLTDLLKAGLEERLTDSCYLSAPL